MASQQRQTGFPHDQAEGLRRMLAGPKPRVLTLLSVLPEAEKSATLINLGASLAGAGREVVLLDASPKADGVAARLGGAARAGCALDESLPLLPQGFRLAALHSAQQQQAAHRLEQWCAELARRSDLMLVDAALAADGGLPLAMLAEGEMVVQVSADAASITAGYALIKRLHASFGRRPFGVLVSGASEPQAQLVFRNMAQAASRYLALPLVALGSVPADDHIGRAERLGRAVVDAFPLAGASVAFRRLAGRLAPGGLPLGNHGMLASGVNRGM